MPAIIERDPEAMEFLEAHAQVFDWLHAHRTEEFASSLLRFFDRHGYLTGPQVAAVARSISNPRPSLGDRPAANSGDARKFWEVLQRHARFYAGKLTISRRNADQLCWIKHADAEKVVGKIDQGKITYWPRPGVDMGEVRSMLAEFEGNPLQAAMKFGKLAGRCCSCGRELTDPESIAAGIGPICAGKFE